LPGPIIRTYKNGSIIYFENEKSEHIYVLQKGRVSLISKSYDGKEEIKEDAKLGEFFGVRSALGRFPREETAQVIGGASLLVFKVNEFEAFVVHKPNLMMKMMKVFSNQLRQYHYKVREQLGQHGDTKSPSFELMNVGEVYHKIGEKEHAWYAYQKYVEHYPEGSYVERAKQLLDLAQNGGDYPEDIDPLQYESDRKTKSPSMGGNKKVKENYEKAEKLKNEDNIADALPLYKSVADVKNPGDMEEEKMIEASLFYVGELSEQLEKNEDAIQYFSNFATRFPSSSKLKESIFRVAELSNKSGNKEKAISLYKKVASIPPEDSFTEKANKKTAELEG
jgi:tetratricopeptide (TPR) repeat protein